eukprot:1177324-Prymnesium_polylepis.1
MVVMSSMALIRALGLARPGSWEVEQEGEEEEGEEEEEEEGEEDSGEGDGEEGEDMVRMTARVMTRKKAMKMPPMTSALLQQRLPNSLPLVTTIRTAVVMGTGRMRHLLQPRMVAALPSANTRLWMYRLLLLQNSMHSTRIALSLSTTAVRVLLWPLRHTAVIASACCASWGG